MNTRVTNLDGAMYPVSGEGQDLAVAGVVVQLAALPDTVSAVFVSVDTANVRVRFDGVDPTAATGHQLTPGFMGTWNRQMAQAAKFLAEGAAAHVAATGVQV
jgi:hypothetical protein